MAYHTVSHPGSITNDELEVCQVKRMAARYVMVIDQLYKIRRLAPMLRYISKDEVEPIMKEVHKGVCGSHIREHALSGKILWAGYYWLSMMQDCGRFINRCEKCQIHAPFIHSPIEFLHSMVSPWPLYQWGSNILGLFPLAKGQLKFLIVDVDYFTKWEEAEVVP